MSTKFVAVDVETANANMASICSIGIATFEDSEVTSEWYSLINPKDDFNPINVSIHGIQKEDVRDAPTFKGIADEIYHQFEGVVVVTHTHFDRVAIHQAASRWSIPSPYCTWLDSARVARRTWKECARSGYGLANVCNLIGFPFEHHHALEDAKAAGHIILTATRESGLDINAMLKRVEQPIDFISF